MDDTQAAKLRELATSDNPGALIRGVTRGQVLALLDTVEALQRERDEAQKIARQNISLAASYGEQRDAAMALLRRAVNAMYIGGDDESLSRALLEARALLGDGGGAS